MNMKVIEQIMKRLENGEYQNITELSTILGTPRSTLVRHLNEMEKNNEVELSWGNVRRTRNTNEVNVKTKIEINVEGKRIVAQKATSCIKDGDIIYIDSGSTTAFLVDTIADKEIVIYTNNLFLFQETHKAHFKPIVYVVPGEFYPNTSSIVGTLVLNFLKNIYIDKAFIGVNAVQGNNLFTTNQEEAVLKSEMIRHAKETYVLFDKSKVGKLEKYKFGEIGNKVKGVTE